MMQEIGCEDVGRLGRVQVDHIRVARVFARLVLDLDVGELGLAWLRTSGADVDARGRARNKGHATGERTASAQHTALLVERHSARWQNQRVAFESWATAPPAHIACAHQLETTRRDVGPAGDALERDGRALD